MKTKIRKKFSDNYLKLALSHTDGKNFEDLENFSRSNKILKPLNLNIINFDHQAEKNIIESERRSHNKILNLQKFRIRKTFDRLNLRYFVKRTE